MKHSLTTPSDEHKSTNQAMVAVEKTDLKLVTKETLDNIAALPYEVQKIFDFKIATESGGRTEHPDGTIITSPTKVIISMTPTNPR